MDKNNPQDTLKQFEDDAKLFAAKYSLTRLKMESLNFDRDFRLQDDGLLKLVSEKAVIRTLGKVTKVAIGDDTPYRTFEEAFEATKKHWSEYYKGIRARRSEPQKIAEVKRQKRYRERRKARGQELTRQQ